jgi:hypothetical protein
MMRQAKIAAITARQDDWMRRAGAASIAAFNELIAGDGAEAVIPSRVPVGRLTTQEKGWICSSVVFAWIKTRSEQATQEGWSAEHEIRTTGLSPDPWMAGATATILPRLAEALPDGFDWTQPITAWSKDKIVELLVTAYGLMREAFAARDITEAQITGAGTDANVTARQINGAAGNPLMTAAEFQEFNRDKPYG